MDKKILIEKVESTPLAYQADESNKFLGILEGVAADSNEKTRNGRRYPIELWRNVESSPEFKEAMDTQTCFGECDHPFDDRVDTSIKEVAIVLLNFDINSDGKVYCKFGILDTPNGRLLKSILDSGCQIGVSSRGIGEEITRNGEVIIDPETYIFYGFDAVVMPAVVSARPTMTEARDAKNPGVKSLSESFNREIEAASTKSELESMMRLAEKINLPDSDSIKESINIKLESMNNGENISSKLESDLGNLAQENEDLKTKIAELESIISAKNIRIDESMKVIHRMRDNSRDLSKVIRESKKREANLGRTISEKNETISKISESVDYHVTRGKKLSNKITEASSANDRLRKMISKKNAEIESLTKTCESLRGTINQNNSSSKKVIESKNSEIGRMKSKLTESSKLVSATINKYLKMRCASENLDLNSVVESLPKNYSVEDIDKKVTELSNRRDRLNKIPVRIPARKAVITESYLQNDPAYKEDMQTMTILSNMNK